MLAVNFNHNPHTMQQITAEELAQILKEDPSLQLLDVREPFEHEEYNIGGTNIPLSNIPFQIEEIKAMSEHGDIVLYCRTGGRSAMAQKLLGMQFGVENTFNLLGGVVAWQQAQEE